MLTCASSIGTLAFSWHRTTSSYLQQAQLWVEWITISAVFIYLFLPLSSCTKCLLGDVYDKQTTHEHGYTMQQSKQTISITWQYWMSVCIRSMARQPSWLHMCQTRVKGGVEDWFAVVFISSTCCLCLIHVRNNIRPTWANKNKYQSTHTLSVS